MHKIDQQLNLMLRGRFDEGWKLSEQLFEEDPNNQRALFNRGWFLINQGKLQEGFQLLEVGRHLNVYGGTKPHTKKPIWNQKDSLQGKTVIINAEGGYGDNIIHARFAADIAKRGGKAIHKCAPELESLFRRIPGTYDVLTSNNLSRIPHDYWVPGFSCAWLFGHSFETLPNEPYISANAESVGVWKNIITSDKIKVGIRWSGSRQFEHQQFRIFPPEPLIDLYKYDKLQLYSLQRDNDIRELPEEIIDLQNLLISWEDTAAAIYNMDLIITSCTSIAHLASAMGKPTWVFVPMLPYHIWAYGDKHSPWYKETTRIFRQTRFGHWDKTFEELNNELKERFNL